MKELVENVHFRHWQDAHQLSLTDAARSIDLTRRTVSQYRTGARPVADACITSAWAG
jgi:predicted transcriptional regulator